MAVLRYIVPALAVAAGAAAQLGGTSSACSAAATTTIQSQSDASALSGCSTFTGSIAIASGTTDNIDLSGIQRITGDLVSNNATAVSQISAGQLSSIGGMWSLQGLTVLSTLNFPSLVSVGSIDWNALPALQGLTFAQGIQKLGDMSIQNTQLNSLNGINLQMADTIFIVNNPYLDDINMQLGNITNAMTLSFNGNKLNAQFPNLMWAYNMTLRGLDQISTPSLASVNGSFGLYSGTFSSFSAPNLTNVGGAFSVVSNNQLSNISAPQLTNVNGGFTIVNNSDIQSINGFPALAVIGGAATFGGTFSNITLPALKDVKGAFYINAASQSTCDAFRKESGSNAIIKGKYNCTPTASTSSSGSGSNSGAGASSSPSTGAGISLVIPGTTGLLGVVAAIFGML